MLDTQTVNAKRHAIAETDDVWLFGYGSLIYKVDFPYLEKRPARLSGWARRFWQGSHDHRGTIENPGRVLTLIRDRSSVCFGMAYRVKGATFSHLDHREKNGYLRHEVKITWVDQQQSNWQQNSQVAIVYQADEHNAAYLGPQSERAIAQQILSSEGPSGPNREYLFRLADALRSLGEEDDHVFAIEAAAYELLKNMNQ